MAYVPDRRLQLFRRRCKNRLVVRYKRKRLFLTCTRSIPFQSLSKLADASHRSYTPYCCYLKRSTVICRVCRALKGKSSPDKQTVSKLRASVPWLDWTGGRGISSPKNYARGLQWAADLVASTFVRNGERGICPRYPLMAKNCVTTFSPQQSLSYQKHKYACRQCSSKEISS